MTEITDDELVDAYEYLLARFLVLRQEHQDVGADGSGYNTLRYNPLGSAEFVNPNLDVAYLEAWIAVDAQHAVLLEVPDAGDRYSTVQVLDGWGEVLANVNERTFPDHPSGTVAFTLAGTEPEVPSGALRVELPAAKAKVLARVELQDTPDEAVALQRAFRVRAPEGVVVEPAYPVPAFTNARLLGAEIFTHAAGVLAGCPDSMPSAPRHQAVAAAAAELVDSGPEGRARVEEVIRTVAVPHFLAGARQFGTHRDGWSVLYTAGRFGDDVFARAVVDYGGLWANVPEEAIYFVGQTDADGRMLEGSSTYEIRFPADGLPGAVVDAFWSLTLYSVPDYRVVPNALDRYDLASRMALETNADGSLSLWLGPDVPPGAPRSNWLPTPAGAGFSLNLRMYVAHEAVTSGHWFPAPIRRHAEHPGTPTVEVTSGP